MKYTAALVLAAAASTEAFGPFGGKKAPAPAPVAKEAPKGKSIAARVFDMDLFAPKADQNDYGARGRKNLKQGTITAGSSYVPSGLTADEYNKIRKEAAAKKEANYQRNVAKAGKFLDYTKFYLDRGTDVSQDWFKSATKGHQMAKTKYDWSGDEDKPLWAKKK